MMFDEFAAMAQGAVAGLGLALLPTFLIEEELRRGDLVTALDLPYTAEERYYLVWPTERAGYPPLQAFKQWLLAETAAGR
jgi:LysR family glycine cleavage system transcriptional activator